MKGALFDIAGPRTAEASGYSEFFHSPVHFEAPASALVMPCEWLDIPNPLADPRAHADALSELEAMERRFRQDGWAVREVVRVLEDSIGVPPLKSVAASVQVSSRTLERLLTEAQTSYRELVEEHRRHRAARLLRDERLPVSEVGYRLGYSDPANFSRACRRWFGTSPSDYRKLNGPPR